MVEQDSGVLVTSPKPLDISFKLIFDVLSSLFEDHAPLILSSIKRIIVVKEDSPYFSTMGITKEGTLYISQSFWDQHMQDKDALATVLMHELMHVIGGDVVTFKTKEEDPDYKLRNQADLIAMDSRINAYICSNRKEINPSRFFKSFYNEEAIENDFLTKLLRPDSVFSRIDKVEKDLLQFYTSFYSTKEFCNHSELSDYIFEILKKRQEENPEQQIKIVLLGSHGEDGQELSDEDLEQIKNAIIEENSDFDGSSSTSQLDEDIKEAVLERISSETFEYSQEAGHSSTAAQSVLDMSGRISQKLSLVKFRNMMTSSIFSNVKQQARKKIAKYSYSPVLPMSLSSTDLILASSGVPPLLWRTKKYDTVLDNQLLPIYLDVSGSTYSFLPKIIKLITNASKEIDYVWGFSNNVVKHDIKDLKEGKINSTGGTDFVCILNHALENKYKHIVVITDGWASNPYSLVEGTSRLPEIKSVSTVLFGGPNKDNYFSAAYGNTFDLDEVLD